MLRFAAIGLDHRHIYHHVGELIAAGAECAGYCPQTIRSPRARRVSASASRRCAPVDRAARCSTIPRSTSSCCAAIPRDRAGIAIAAMRRGKDVMVDKPGVTTSTSSPR